MGRFFLRYMLSNSEMNLLKIYMLCMGYEYNLSLVSSSTPLHFKSLFLDFENTRKY